MDSSDNKKLDRRQDDRRQGDRRQGDRRQGDRRQQNTEFYCDFSDDLQKCNDEFDVIRKDIHDIKRNFDDEQNK